MVFKKKEKKLEVEMVESSADLAKEVLPVVETPPVKEEVVVSTTDTRVETDIKSTRITAAQKNAIEQSVAVLKVMLSKSNNVPMRRDLKAWTSLMNELTQKSEIID